jgi:hypothetical protein
MLHNLKTADPVFWDQLTKKTATSISMNETPDLEEEGDNFIDSDVPFEDDSDLSCRTIIAEVHGSELNSAKATADGDLVSMAMAESLDDSRLEFESTDSDDAEELGRGKRKQTENKLYQSFWRHNDGDASDDE